MLGVNLKAASLRGIYMSYAKADDCGFDKDMFRKEDIIPDCPDQFVGIIKNANDWEDFERRSVTVDYEGVGDVKGRVILILESPHRDEYARDGNGELVAKGPACGCTGCKIRRHFNLITSKKYENYELVLVNVIQYPCSLFRGRAQNGCKIRDKMIRRLLKHRVGGDRVFMADFVSRMVCAMGKCQNLVVINACTMVGAQIIKKQLDRMVPHAAIYATAHHPSIWHESTELHYHERG